MKTTTIATLTSLRFVFALFVFLSHLGFFVTSGNASLKWLYDEVFSEGYIGVGFFFMLSGFVLTLNYKQKFLQKEISPKQFFIARIARIFPLHLVMILIALPLSFSPAHPIDIDWLTKLGANGFLIQSWIPIYSFQFSFNIVSWSISNEFFFYALFPILILVFGRFRKMSFFIFLVLATIGISLVCLFLSEEYQHTYLYAHPVFRLVDFVIGIALFDCYETVKSKNTITDKWYWELGVLVIFIVFFSFHKLVPQGFRYAMYYWPVMIVVILVFAMQKGFLSKWLSNRIMVYLGEISFGFYMIHWLAIRYFDVFLKRFGYEDRTVFFAFIVFCFSIVASMISYRWIEKPLGSGIKKIYFLKNGN